MLLFLKTKPNSSPSHSSDWKLDPEELASLFNSKTKLIIINTPHNPLGKVFDYDELTMIADLAKKHNVLVISDEVYEWLVYEPTKHIRMGNLILAPVQCATYTYIFGPVCYLHIHFRSSVRPTYRYCRIDLYCIFNSRYSS